MGTQKYKIPSKKSGPPEPVPEMANLHRTAEAGIDTRQYLGLDRNERVSPFPEWFMEKIRESVNSTLLTWYPSTDQLYRQLAESLQVPESKLILTPSSDAAFKALYQAYVQPGDSVVMLDPSYAMFPVYSQMFGGKSILVPYNRDLELDTEFLLKSIVKGVRLVMLANPNQPTGTILDEDVLTEVIERAADVGALVAMDEAYYPFGRSTVLPLIQSYPNLLVTRTFSKAAGLAGLRIGFVVGHPDVVSNLYKLHTVNDINSMSILCAGHILEYPQIVDDYVSEVEAGGRVFAEQLPALGLASLPTHTNFALVRVSHICQPQQLVEALKHRGYLVKSMDSPCVSDCIRVTLGPPAMMSDFVTCLQQVLEQGI